MAGRRRSDDIPDAELDRLAEEGFDWIWLLSVWRTGPAAQQVSRSHPDWRKEFQETLPDLREEDIAGSGFAIAGYTVHGNLGGDAALARLRERLRKRGLRLMLDFVANHMAPDHPWIDEHPDYFVHGSESDLVRAPRNYCRVQTKRGPLVLAAATRTLTAGPTHGNSTTATRTCSRRWLVSLTSAKGRPPGKEIVVYVCLEF